MARVMLIWMMVLLCAACVAGNASAQTVLFDNTHGERFLIGEKGTLQLSSLADVLQAAGARVSTLDQPISEASLAGADALVISGAFSPLSKDEIEAVTAFMKKGGKLAVMLHVAPPMAGLLDRLRVNYTNGVIQERENVLEDDPQRFKVTRLGSHPVLAGVSEMSLHGVWGLINTDGSARVVASTGPHAWVDLRHDKVQTKENTASFGVVVAGDVGKGGFLVFGDDAIFQNKFLSDNKALAANLAGWFK